MTDQTHDTPDWLPERLERAKQQAIQDLLADLDHENVDSLKATLVNQQHQITTLTRAHDAAQTRAEQAMFEAAFTSATRPYSFQNADDVRALLDVQALDTAEDGSITGMDDAIKHLVESRPYLLAPAHSHPPTDMNIHQTTSAQPSLSTPQVDAIKRRFRLD